MKHFTITTAFAGSLLSSSTMIKSAEAEQFFAWRPNNLEVSEAASTVKTELNQLDPDKFEERVTFNKLLESAKRSSSAGTAVRYLDDLRRKISQKTRLKYCEGHRRNFNRYLHTDIRRDVNNFAAELRRDASVAKGTIYTYVEKEWAGPVMVLWPFSVATTYDGHVKWRHRRDQDTCSSKEYNLNSLLGAVGKLERVADSKVQEEKKEKAEKKRKEEAEKERRRQELKQLYDSVKEELALAQQIESRVASVMARVHATRLQDQIDQATQKETEIGSKLAEARTKFSAVSSSSARSSLVSAKSSIESIKDSMRGKLHTLEQIAETAEQEAEEVNAALEGFGQAFGGGDGLISFTQQDVVNEG